MLLLRQFETSLSSFWRQGRAADDLSNGTIITVRIEYGRGRLTDLRDPATGHYNMVFGSLKAESELRALVHLPVPSRPIGHFHRLQFVRDLISAIDM